MTLHRSVLPPHKPRRDSRRLEEIVAVVALIAVFAVPALVYFIDRWRDSSSAAEVRIQLMKMHVRQLERDVERACPLSIEVAHAVDTLPVDSLRIVGAGTCEDLLRVEWR